MSRLVGSARAAKTRESGSAATAFLLRLNHLVEYNASPGRRVLSTIWLKIQVALTAMTPAWVGGGWVGGDGVGRGAKRQAARAEGDASVPGRLARCRDRAH